MNTNIKPPPEPAPEFKAFSPNKPGESDTMRQYREYLERRQAARAAAARIGTETYRKSLFASLAEMEHSLNQMDQAARLAGHEELSHRISTASRDVGQVMHLIDPS